MSGLFRGDGILLSRRGGSDMGTGRLFSVSKNTNEEDGRRKKLRPLWFPLLVSEGIPA